MIHNEVLSRIAQKIRATRLQKSLTIQQLATRMHVSKGLLSKIENSKTMPSLPVFITLIQSLDISLREFFEDMLLINGREFLLVKNNRPQALNKNEETDGFTHHHILSQNIPHCTMEAALLTIEPGSKGTPATADGFEFRYVLSGTCEYDINNDLILLEEGDAIYLDASVPHTLNNHTRRRASVLKLSFTIGRQ